MRKRDWTRRTIWCNIGRMCSAMVCCNVKIRSLYPGVHMYTFILLTYPSTYSSTAFSEKKSWRILFSYATVMFITFSFFYSQKIWTWTLLRLILRITLSSNWFPSNSWVIFNYYLNYRVNGRDFYDSSLFSDFIFKKNMRSLSDYSFEPISRK